MAAGFRRENDFGNEMLCPGTLGPLHRHPLADA